MAFPPIVALEVGTTMVRALIGEVRDDGHIMIVGKGTSLSRGVRKGEIIDLENALSCTHTALHEAENSSDVLIESVYLLVSGGHIKSMINRGSVPVDDPRGEITREDRQHAMETARAVNLPPDRDVLHTVTQQFYVDDQPGVINPEGMHGAKLGVDMLVIHGVRNRLLNSTKVVERVPMDIEDVVFGGLCAGLAVLTPEEKEQGAAVIDLGGGTTDYIVYAGSTMATAGTLAVGGDHVTNDIAKGLRLPTVQAEKLKKQEGSALLNVSAKGKRVSLPTVSGQPEKFVRLSDLNTIIHVRMEETFSLLRAQFQAQGLLDQLGAGIILTGGGAGMTDVASLAQNVMGVPCRVGRPVNVSGIAEVTESHEYAAPIGLLKYAYQTAMRQKASDTIASKIWKMFTRK